MGRAAVVNVIGVKAASVTVAGAEVNVVTVTQPSQVMTIATDTLWDAAGDLAVGTGANTAARVPIGAALYVWRVNAAGTGLEWAAASAGGTWGTISGTLSDQTDLNTALALKAPLASPTFSGLVAFGGTGSFDTTTGNFAAANGTFSKDVTVTQTVQAGSFVGPLTGTASGNQPIENYAARRVIYVSHGTAATDTRGSNSVYSQAVPFATLAAAKAAAVSGDLIVVEPGSYTISASLAKNGVNWQFYPGSTVTYTANDSTGIWDDGGVAAIFSVVGSGSFIRLDSGGSNAKKMISCSHASSVIHIECLDITVGSDAIASTGEDSAVYCSAGNLSVLCRDIVVSSSTAGGGYGVWWLNGQVNVTGRLCSVRGHAAVYSSVDNAPTGDMHVRFDEFYCSFYGVWDVGVNSVAAIWVRANIVRTDYVSIAAAGASRVYVECQKLFGGIHASGTGLLYVRSDKVAKSSTGTSLFIGSSTVTSRISIQHWDCTGVVERPISNDGNNLILFGGDVIGEAGTAGVYTASGTTRIRGMLINTSANSGTSPLFADLGGTVILDNCTLVAESAADSIFSVDPVTVINYGSRANNAINVNVTVAVQPIVIDGAVV